MSSSIYSTLPSEDVFIQDQHTTLVEFYFRQTLNAITLSANVAIGDYVVNLVAGHSVVAGDVLVIKQNSNWYQAEVVSVAVDACTMDAPFDFAFTTAATAERCNTSLNVNGSVTPVVFFITPANLMIDLDINKIHLHIEDNAAMDTATFGGLAALTRGLLLRVKNNGGYKNVMTIKHNGEFDEHCDLTEYDTKAPAGSYGFSAVKLFNGQTASGVSVRLNHATSDELQLIVQDDLTGLTEFEAIACGHAVTGQ